VNDWSKAVIHPLGLAGFALFLVFGLMGKFGVQSSPSWLLPVCIAMAVLALFGGLLIARTGQLNKKPPSPSPTTETYDIRQDTRGSESPAIAGPKGSVTITYHDKGESGGSK
jgi:hypothetical protein